MLDFITLLVGSFLGAALGSYVAGREKESIREMAVKARKEIARAMQKPAAYYPTLSAEEEDKMGKPDFIGGLGLHKPGEEQGEE